MSEWFENREYKNEDQHLFNLFLLKFMTILNNQI